MKKKYLYALTLFFSFCLLFFSCRKEISFVIHDRDFASKGVLQSAKLWYQQHIDPQAPKIKKYGALPAYWKKAWTKKKQEWLFYTFRAGRRLLPTGMEVHSGISHGTFPEILGGQI